MAAALDEVDVERGMALLDESMLAAMAGRVSPVITGLVYCGVIASCQRIHAIERAREWTAALSDWCDGQDVGRGVQRADGRRCGVAVRLC